MFDEDDHGSSPVLQRVIDASVDGTCMVLIEEPQTPVIRCASALEYQPLYDKLDLTLCTSLTQRHET